MISHRTRRPAIYSWNLLGTMLLCIVRSYDNSRRWEAQTIRPCNSWLSLRSSTISHWNPPFRVSSRWSAQKREEHIEIVTFSWKRPNFGYDSVWLHYYHTASRCLSMHSTSIISVIIEKRRTVASLYSHDFSHFEDILACCR